MTQPGFQTHAVSQALQIGQTATRPLFGWVATLIMLALGCWLMAVCWQEWLSESVLAANFDCESGRRWLIQQLGGRTGRAEATGVPAQIPFESMLVGQFVITLLCWFAGAGLLARRICCSFSQSLLVWGSHCAIWSMLSGSWTVWRLLATLCGWDSAVVVFSHFSEMWLSLAVAGWISSFICLYYPSRGTPGIALAIRDRIPLTVWAAILTYTVAFGILNTLLYNNLLVPHGDSAMYEEHLWNLLHGKGFRSFIDKGLFLGEHIQVIHLGLIPIYLIWPSHILLEWCESLALALGAIPVYLMAVRHVNSRSQASCLALAYLLFVPMQRLDISIDFKTFRPEAFGIPLLLAALNSLEGRQWRAFGCWIVAALLVKEDYALILGPLGLWMAVHAWFSQAVGPKRWKSCVPGILLSVASVAYLFWAVKFAIPYFKAGNDVHYVKYFAKFGNSTNEILFNLITKPALLWSELVTAENALFGAALVFSLALLPLWSPSHLAVGLPLFGALCLNDIARNTQHHFHAPLVAIVFWASAAGLGNFHKCASWWAERRGRTNFITMNGARFVALMTLFTSAGYHLWHGMGPGSLPFWDSHSGAYWRKKYVATQRAAEFAKVAALIPPDKRVAATDFVHPRFNHHDRCYDYSGYRPDVPDDAEYLVIDVHGPYSQITDPSDVEEYRNHRDRWELLPDMTNGEFYVFRRRREEPRP